MATINEKSADKDNESDIFNCPICLDRFKTPRCLPCQHSFCEACLQTYIQSSETDESGESLISFPCPFCRQTIKSPDPNSKPCEWASLFPTNRVLVSLIENSVVGEKSCSRRCGPCERDNESSPGVFWCSHCLECYCEMCTKYHKRIKSTMMHKLIPIDVADVEAPVVEIDEPCPDHPKEIIKVYCNDHKNMCCVLCLAGNHRECKQIESLDEIAGNMTDKVASEFVDHLKEIKERTVEIRQRKKENMDCLNRRYDEISSEVDILIETAKSELDNLKGKFKINLTTLHKQHQMKHTGTIEKTETLKKTLDHGEKMLKAVSNGGSYKQSFIAMEKIKSQVGLHTQGLNICSDDDNEIIYDLLIDSSLRSFLGEESLLTIKTSNSPCKQKLSDVLESIKSLCEVQHMTNNQLMNADITDLGAVKLWDVKGIGLFTDGDFLTNGSLVCCDANQSMLKVFDKCGKLLLEKKLQYRPLCLAVNKENEIFVTAYLKNFLTIYTKPASSLKVLNELHKITVPSPAKGIAVQDNKMILACDKTIEVMTTIGQKLLSIPFIESALDVESIFVSIGPGTNNFSYFIGRTVVSQSLDGAVVAKYELPTASLSRGIAIDKKRNVFVCRTNSKSICVVSDDFKHDCTFLTTNIRPYAIGFDDTGKRFFVTACRDVSEIKEEGPLIEMYELCLKSKS